MNILLSLVDMLRWPIVALFGLVLVYEIATRILILFELWGETDG